MAIIIGILVVITLFIYFLFSNTDNNSISSAARSKSPSKEEQILNDNLPWLRNRWSLAKSERAAGELSSVPHWFFDEITERQIRKIEEIGLTIKGNLPTKGEASDLIGLFESAEDEAIEILRFFKISLKGMNQSRARHEVDALLKSPENLEKWKNRPASAMQKEFYRFFALKAPQGLTHEVASTAITDFKEKLSDEDKERLDEWDTFEDIYDEINDPDYREDYDLKSISISLYRSAMDKLKSEGKTIKDISDDRDIVVDTIIKIKPEIQKL